MRIGFLTVAAAASALLLASCTTTKTTTTGSSPGTTGGSGSDAGTTTVVNAPAAKGLFTSNNCTACHGVSEQGIAGGDTGPDLSHVGATRSATWIHEFLMHRETISGEVHMKTFKGTEADAETIAVWLASLK